MQGWIRWIAFSFVSISAFSFAAEPFPVEHFSQLPKFTRPQLSPKGTMVAYVQNLQQNGIAVLTTFNLTTGEVLYLVQSDNEEMKINWFEWIDEETLVLSIRYASSRYGTDTVETRLVAIDAKKDRDEMRLLIKPKSGGISDQHFSQFQDNVIDFLNGDPEHILIAVDLDIPNMPSVYKLNVKTGRKSRIEKGKRKIRDWMTDQQGRVRIGMTLDYKDGDASTLIRGIGEDDDWETYFEYNALTDPSIDPAGFDLDPNILYFKQYKGDKRALYKIDLRTKQQELVFEDPDYDVNGRLIYSKKTGAVIGLNHSNTPTGRIYWDADRDKLQRSFDAALPDTDNYLVDFSQDENIYLLYTENDFTPGVYYLGNRKEATLDLMFDEYPELTADNLSAHKLLTYKARDGVEIQGYLSLPKGANGPVPTILHPHGGPGARDVSGFDYWTSYFTSRGYAVFRPNFRGSTGYGYEFSQSQMKGWGLEMQDDLEDAAHWLVDTKVAQAGKICIVGASYGGYAAMMGIVKTPDLYKCAVSFAGVSNLKRLVRDSRKYTNSKFVKNQIGDDSDDLENRSPYYQVSKIKTPILLVHGKDDRVVDVNQSQMMAEELEDENKDFEYIELKNGDHYLSIQRNRHDFFRAMDAFLQKHLQ